MRDKRLSRVDEEELEEILERRHKFEARKKRRKKLVIIGLIAARFHLITSIQSLRMPVILLHRR